MAILVQVTTLETPGEACTARKAHLLPCTFQILFVEEILGDPAGHLIRTVAEDLERARANAQQRPVRVGNKDKVLRRLKNTLVDKLDWVEARAADTPKGRASVMRN